MLMLIIIIAIPAHYANPIALLFSYPSKKKKENLDANRLKLQKRHHPLIHTFYFLPSNPTKLLPLTPFCKTFFTETVSRKELMHVRPHHPTHKTACHRKAPLMSFDLADEGIVRV